MRQNDLMKKRVGFSKTVSNPSKYEHKEIANPGIDFTNALWSKEAHITNNARRGGFKETVFR
jgi:hypothetical protein